MTQSLRQILIIVLASLAMLVAFPADAKSKRSQMKQFEVSRMKYASSIRWNEFEMAWGYVEPFYRKDHPLTDLEVERLKQIQVTGYEEKFQETLADGSIELRAEIRLINRHTQAERVIMNTQLWRWDEVSKRWWLTNGLPDFYSSSR